MPTIDLAERADAWRLNLLATGLSQKSPESDFF
jgi:hypothetical protein